MGDDPTAPDAVPRSQPVPDSVQRADRSTLRTRVANQAERAIDRLLADSSVARRKNHASLDADRLEAPVRPATQRRSGKDIEASPLLSLPRVKHPEAIALFVHGGDVTSRIPARRADPAYLRLVPFARDVERRSHGRVGGAVLRLSMRGWNDPDLPALGDTEWALRVLRQRFPGVPMGLVGHSMGGRVVLHLGDEARAQAIVALAPWAADIYDAGSFAQTPLLLMHGRIDTTTDPHASEGLARRVKERGGDAEYVDMAGGHSMLRNAADWHRRTSEFLMERLLQPARRSH